MPSELGVEITNAQECVLMKGLALRPENRYQSAMQLREALREVCPQSVAERKLPAINFPTFDLSTFKLLKIKIPKLTFPDIWLPNLSGTYLNWLVLGLGGLLLVLVIVFLILLLG
jgi:hypothetical protein